MNFVRAFKNTSYKLERLVFIPLLITVDMFRTVLGLIYGSCVLKLAGPDSFQDIIGSSYCHIDWNGMYTLFLEHQSEMFMMCII